MLFFFVYLKTTHPPRATLCKQFPANIQGRARLGNNADSVRLCMETHAKGANLFSFHQMLFGTSYCDLNRLDTLQFRTCTAPLVVLFQAISKETMISCNKMNHTI